MADWIQGETQHIDPKGRLLTYPYHFQVAMRVFDQGRSQAVWDEATQWVRDRFGYHSDGYRLGGWMIEFKFEADAIEFKMRWC